jgi:hypothetical protein
MAHLTRLQRVSAALLAAGVALYAYASARAQDLKPEAQVVYIAPIGASSISD